MGQGEGATPGRVAATSTVQAPWAQLTLPISPLTRLLTNPAQPDLTAPDEAGAAVASASLLTCPNPTGPNGAQRPGEA